jgi:oxygen-independent coproporphyrinogen-3 oxidase
VQSFHDDTLDWMHRTHDSEAARRAITTLRDAGIENLSIDLIFAVPAHLGRSWSADLDAALALELPHLSVYGLTIEPHTPLGRWVAREDVAEAPEDAFEREFLQAHDALSHAGYEHYEVSNYGKPAQHSRHNWAYWRRLPYGGLGPSAHGFDGTRRRWNVAPYSEWLRRVSRGEDPEGGSETLGPEQVHSEEVYLGLRTQVGLGLSGAEAERVTRWVEAGWATLGDRNDVRLTPVGWLRLDALANDLTMLRSRY